MSYLSGRRVVFKFPAIRWMVLGCLLANLGAGMVLLTMSWAIVNVHDSVAALAGLMICYWLPSVIFASVIGYAVDAYKRKSVVIATKACRVLILVLVAYSYHRSPRLYLLYTLAFGMGACTALYMPAFMAMVREVVPDN